MLLSVFCLCLPLLQVVVVRAADDVASPLSFEGLKVLQKYASIPSSGNTNDSKIIGGEPATEGQFPWQVSLTTERGLMFFCGGSVLSHEFVLTAAHCIFQLQLKDLHMFFGSLDNMHEDVVRGASALIIHERFVLSPNILNDIGLIRLDSPLPEQWTALIQPIRLPRRSQASLLLDNENTTVSGWGQTSFGGPMPEKLRWTTVLVMPLAECVEKVRKYYNIFINETHICTDTSTGHMAFKGDSGGALVWKDPDGVNREVGIVSFGSPFAIFGGPSVFTRVTAYLDWIESHTGLHIEP